jgi:preprotein translocase subunit Sec61beta
LAEGTWTGKDLMLFVSESDYRLISLFWIGLAIAVLVALIFFRAPYGRHERKGWGVRIPARIGWVLMETIPVVFLSVLLILGSNREPVVLLFWAAWTAHYINRAWAWPARARISGKMMPLSIVFMALFFNGVNTWLNGMWLFELTPNYGLEWLIDPRFIIGAIIFFTGMIINIKSDDILFALRDDGSTGYKIPRGGLFEKVSCPNYLGEIIEWTGWAIATWSLAGATFAIWTACNLAPRALAHHKWYKEEFDEYPEERKALIPFLL